MIWLRYHNGFLIFQKKKDGSRGIGGKLCRAPQREVGTQQTVSVAGKFLHNFKQEEWETVVLPTLLAWNEEKNDPPLPKQEVMSIYESLAKKESTSRNDVPKEARSWHGEDRPRKARTLLTVSSILNMPESEKPEFLVNMLIPETGITALSGHPGCGKSWFMLHLAQCVATGERFLDQLQTKKGNVLIVDEESGVWEMKRRMKLLGYPDDLPVYFYCQSGFKVDKENDLDELLRAISDNNIKLIVVDPFVAIHSKIENSAEEAQSVMERLQRFNEAGAAVLFIHHHRKGGIGSGGQSLRGSSAYSGRLDSHITVEKADETTTTTTLNIEHVKSRRGKNLAQFRVVLSQEDLNSPISLMYDEGVSGKEIKKEQARRVVVELLKQGAMTTEEVISEVQGEIEIGVRNIHQALKDLETDKLVVTERDGRKKKYTLVDTVEEKHV